MIYADNHKYPEKMIFEFQKNANMKIIDFKKAIETKTNIKKE